MTFTIAPATPADLPTLLGLIRELAAFEELGHMVECNEADLHAALFGQSPCAEALLVRDGDHQAVAYAIWFKTFSSFLGKPGFWLEDIYVRQEHRQQGLGRLILAYIAALAVERGYGRFEWSVLDWNTPAQSFYTSIGANVLPDWRITRLVGEGLTRFAAEPK
jgi:GNAT superfamily N-acetyltransferase